MLKGASLTSLQDGWRGTYHPTIRRRCPWSPPHFVQSRAKGKSMREAHTGMGITEAEFAIIAGHFAAAMDQAGVSAQDHAAIMGVLSGMHDDIVGH